MKFTHRPTSTNLEPHVGCIASAAEILGQKWTALIIRDLHAGQKGFCELERTVEGINPRTLSQRLDELEQHKIVARKASDEVSNRVDYRLTQKGQDLVPILKNMADWGNRYPATTCE